MLFLETRARHTSRDQPSGIKDLFKSLGATVYAHYYRPSRIPKSVPKPRKILKCQKGHKLQDLLARFRQNY